MSAVAESAAVDQTPKTPAEKLREKRLSLRKNRTRVAVVQKKASTTNTVERLLTPEERRKMKKRTRKNQKNDIERLMKQYGITDDNLRKKVFAGIQNGTLGSEPELKRFLEQEKAKMEETKKAAAEIPDTKISSEMPVAGFSLADLRRSG